MPVPSLLYVAMEGLASGWLLRSRAGLTASHRACVFPDVQGILGCIPSTSLRKFAGAPRSCEGKHYPWGFIILATVGVFHMPPVLLNICRISSLDPSNSLWVTHKGGQHRHMCLCSGVLPPWGRWMGLDVSTQAILS